MRGKVAGIVNMSEVPITESVLNSLIRYCRENGHRDLHASVSTIKKYRDLLRWTAHSGSLNVLKHVLSLKAIVAKRFGSEMLSWAACCGHLDMVEHILSLDGIDATCDNNRAIGFAARYGHLHIIERLLVADGADAAANDNYAIMWAASNGFLDVVERLLTVDGVDATATNNCAIRWAVMHGRRSVVNRLLLVDGVDASVRNNIAIILAVQYAYFHIVERLMIDPNVMNHIEHLFSNRAACQTLSKRGLTPNMLAALGACSLPREEWGYASEWYEPVQAYRTQILEILDWLGRSQYLRFDLVNIVYRYCVGKY